MNAIPPTTQSHSITQTHSTTQKPWYKQFWPWFLIALPTAAVIASFISLDIAIENADTPVEDDYVQHGLTVLHKTALHNDTQHKTNTETRDAKPQR